MPRDRVFVRAGRRAEEHPAAVCSQSILQFSNERPADALSATVGEDARELDPRQAPQGGPHQVADDAVVFGDQQLVAVDLALEPRVAHQEPFRGSGDTEFVLDRKETNDVGGYGGTNRSHFGGMRSAPSRRIVSPFRNAFSMMCRASAAYSNGSPKRFGCEI